MDCALGSWVTNGVPKLQLCSYFTMYQNHQRDGLKNAGSNSLVPNCLSNICIFNTLLRQFSRASRFENQGCMSRFSPASCLQAIGSFSSPSPMCVPWCIHFKFRVQLVVTLGFGFRRQQKPSQFFRIATLSIIPALPEILPLGIDHGGPLGNLRAK